MTASEDREPRFLFKTPRRPTWIRPSTNFSY